MMRNYKEQRKIKDELVGPISYNLLDNERYKIMLAYVPPHVDDRLSLDGGNPVQSDVVRNCINKLYF